MKLLHRFKNFITHLIGIVFFAWVLSFMSDEGCISSFSELAPINRELDFKSSDFYQLVSDARAVKVLDEQIVIVPIDNLSRNDICHLIEDISLCSPKAIGLDVFFRFPMDNDEHFLDVIRNTPELVVATGVTTQKNNIIEGTYFLDSLNNSLYGVVNMNIQQRYHVIRDFKPYYQTNHGVIDHFSLSLAKHVNPSIAKHLQSTYEMNSETAIPIDFSSREFDIIEPGDVLEHIEKLKGKVVMLGDINDTQDIFITPVDDNMSGVMVHAYSLSTILGERYYTMIPQWILWLLGLFLCIIFVVVKMWLKNHSLENLLMRVFQILTMMTITYLGCILFIKYHYVLELSMPLMIIALGLAALDVWDDIVHVTPKIFEYMKKHLLSRFHILGLLLLLTGTLQASTYRIYKMEGDVRILKNDKWVTPQASQELSVRDQFMIGSQGRLGIVVNETHRIYYTVSCGKQNVAQIISAARKQSDRIASNMHKQLVDNKQQKGSSLPVFGGVNRGSMQENTTTELVYATIYQYIQERSHRSDTQITAEKVVDGDSYYFKASNHTGKPLYANVIRLPLTPDEHPQVCMEVGYTMNEPFLIMGPQQETSWSGYSFLCEEPRRQYLLFASEQPYDCQALQMMLRTMSPPELSSDNGTKVYLYFIH